MDGQVLQNRRNEGDGGGVVAERYASVDTPVKYPSLKAADLAALILEL